MRKIGVFAAAAFLFALPGVAQEKPGNIGRVFVTTPKAGMTQQYEEGRKRHMDSHRKQGDTWTWEVWQVETGESMGAYVVITGGHNWKDFDDWDAKYGKIDTADGATNLAPFSGSEMSSFWTYLGNISRPAESKEPPKMSQVIHFLVKPGAEEEFFNAIKKIHEGIGKTNWPPRYAWYALVNGGEQPQFVLVLPRNSWADMAEPEMSFDAMLEKAFGRYDAEALDRALGKSIARQWSSLLVHRPDLSYRPAGK